MKPGPVKLLIADDHQLFLDGVVSLLKDEPSFSITATAHDGYEVLRAIDQSPIDVCLLDISMPNLDGIATARQIRTKQPDVKIIVLTTYNDREIIDELSQLGVKGYLLKNCTRQQLVEGISRVAAGETYFSPEVEKTILSHFSSIKQKEPGVVLTQREIEILKLLAREYTNEKIAHELKISFRTVETHRKNMMQKTKAHNLAGLLAFAYNQGLLK